MIAELLKEAIGRLVGPRSVAEIREEEQLERDAPINAAEIAASTTATLLAGEKFGRRIGGLLDNHNHRGLGADQSTDD